MAKLITPQEAAELFHDGMSVMIGGFLGCGVPYRIIDALVEKNVRDLTVISNDPTTPGCGLGKLIANHQVKRFITSHIGLNPDVRDLMDAGELEVCLLPQGSLAEMVRAGGSGLGGIITRAGLGTVVEESPLVHSKITMDGREYLVMMSLHSDVSIINGYKVDPAGNIWYRGTTRNFNPLMATAADLVICEADTLVDVGDIEPENVATSGIFVDYIVDGGACHG